MAEKTEAAPAKSDKPSEIERLVKKAEQLLLAEDGYNRPDEYNRGVQDVIDLLKRHR